jgi:hypothetical protein
MALSSKNIEPTEYDNFFDTRFDSEDLENKDAKKIMTFKK